MKRSEILDQFEDLTVVQYEALIKALDHLEEKFNDIYHLLDSIQNIADLDRIDEAAALAKDAAQELY